MSEANDQNAQGFSTRAIHAGQRPDPTTGAVMTPVYLTSTYVQDAPGVHKGYEYSRTHNPTRNALQDNIASLEGGRHGLAFGSGLAATHAVFSLLSAGDRVIVGHDVYGGTYRLLDQVMTRQGLVFDVVDTTDLAAVDAALATPAKLVWFETPTNPLLHVSDIAAVCSRAKAAGAIAVVDNTFATPYLQNPLALGAHVAVHSTTKYIGGHSDVIGGAVVIDDEEMDQQLRFTRNATGGVLGPWDAWLTLRGLKTLAIRMREHEANATRVAAFLKERPEVERVYYPGLPDHPGHDLAKRQMRGFGGMVTVDVVGGEATARRFCEATRVFSLAESLGGIESLIGYPFLMSHGAFPAEEKRRKGISEATVRLSVGIENADDLCADLA